VVTVADILNQIDESIARNAARFDPLGPDPRTFKNGGGWSAFAATIPYDESQAQGSAPTCRGCRATSPRLGTLLCDPCRRRPSCDNSRVNGVNGRHMVCIRPAGHQPPCEEGHPDGSQWYPSGVEQDGYWVATPVPRAFLIRALDGEADAYAERAAAAVDELVERTCILASCDEVGRHHHLPPLPPPLYCAGCGRDITYSRACSRCPEPPWAAEMRALMVRDTRPWWRRYLPGGTR
jgi:hypothetical protein